MAEKNIEIKYYTVIEYIVEGDNARKIYRV